LPAELPFFFRAVLPKGPDRAPPLRQNRLRLQSPPDVPRSEIVPICPPPTREPKNSGCYLRESSLLLRRSSFSCPASLLRSDCSSRHFFFFRPNILPHSFFQFSSQQPDLGLTSSLLSSVGICDRGVPCQRPEFQSYSIASVFKTPLTVCQAGRDGVCFLAALL